MSTERKIVLASSNPGKLKEFRELFQHLNTEIISQEDLGIASPLETGLTFIENALLKARHASQMTQLPVLSDDSGLVIPVLNGAPGIYSARFAGDGASDHFNRNKLLEAMLGFKGIQRRGYYISAVTLMNYPSDPDPIVAIGRWNGQIIHTPKGNGGFGYDPIFLPDGQDQTAAEMSISDKNTSSHRALAVQELLTSSK